MAVSHFLSSQAVAGSCIKSCEEFPAKNNLRFGRSPISTAISQLQFLRLNLSKLFPNIALEQLVHIKLSLESSSIIQKHSKAEFLK